MAVLKRVACLVPRFAFTSASKGFCGSSPPTSARRSISSTSSSSTIANPTSGKAASTSPVPTELLTVIEETIKTHGPLPISRYMTLCLSHPTLGYYTTKSVFGADGDFITSPEISQIFGELLAIWYVTQWAQQGAPRRVRIIELGPGRGTLLADICRTFKALPSQSSPPVTSIHLVESSAALREVQRQKLVATGFGDVQTNWWKSVDEIPSAANEFTMVIAHEFFDALPINVFENTPKGWREVMVDVPDRKSIIVSSAPKQSLRLVLSPAPTPASILYTHLSTAQPPQATLSSSLSFDSTLPPPSPAALIRPARLAKQPVGARMEISPASWEVGKGMARLLDGSAGGAGLVVDYGDEKAFGRSWRGFRKHQIVDPLSKPGHTDLTANVDFAYLADAMIELVDTHGPLSQGAFLESLGLHPRLSCLLAKAAEDRKKEIESAAKRLVEKTGMGTEYKVMAFTPKGVVIGCFPFTEKP